MSQPLNIELQDADSGTNLGCKLKGDFFEEEARLDTIGDVIISTYGNMYLSTLCNVHLSNKGVKL